LRVVVLGTGHVGLVTCASLAHLGHEVVGVDSDEEKVAALEDGTVPFHEPGLQDLVTEGVASGRLSFSRDGGSALEEADIVFICVGTPARADGEANLLAVEQAARTVARHALREMIVVEKSTVPAGTAGRVKRALRDERPELASRLEVVSNPEFLREGKAVQDSVQPDRILVGAESDWALERMRTLYAALIDRGVRLIETDIHTAELSKHACNAFLALKVSYINAIARLCERSGADVMDVAEVMGSDPRIGRAFLNAGLGYGGFCFPKDIQAFERLSSRLGYEFGLLHEVARINDQTVDSALEKLRDALWNLEEKRIGLLGLSFKPDTDDVRFSPALALAKRLLDEGSVVVGYDPEAGPNAKTEVPDLEIASDPYDAARKAHCLVLCTEWDEFKQLDLVRLKEEMVYPVIIDGRNLFDPADMAAGGFTYYPAGRPALT
jgi:UDPglucose 6-dehydrogenase